MEYFNSLGLVGVFLSSFLAATILPFSSEAVLGAYLLNGENYFLAIILATIGNVLGGMTNYVVGRMGKFDWAHKYLKISYEQISKYQRKIEKHGSLLAFFTWLPIIGDPIALALGYFHASYKKVLIFMIIGKGLRYFFLYYALDSLRSFF